MIVAVVAGVIVGGIFAILVASCVSEWGRQHLPAWFVEHAPGALMGLIGVVASIVVSKIAHDDSASLFWVQVAVSIATMVVVLLPLRSRLRVE